MMLGAPMARRSKPYYSSENIKTTLCMEEKPKDTFCME